MDPIGLGCAAVLAAAALYRATRGAQDRSLTAGLWTAAAGIFLCAAVPALDPVFSRLTGLANLTQLISYTLMVASSYLVARFTYRAAELAPKWPFAATLVSIAGTTAIYATTELSSTPVRAIDTANGWASLLYALFFAAGLLPTHIAALLAASKTAKPGAKNVARLLYIYGAIGALAPALIVVDHTSGLTLRWPMTITYPLISIWFLISWGALSIAGVIGANRAGRHQAESRGILGERTPTP